ncbi:MAG: hypothetical protein H0U98_01060 [Alphaproteobacteria bacterium]|nr:hypothetical protein [Alphaproteobacteria bacterium]
MAKANNTIAASTIATLAQSRAAIFSNAASADGRALTLAELDHVNALSTVIANSVASNRADAAIQVSVALEMVELFGEINNDGWTLENAHAALRSAASILRPKGKGSSSALAA